MGYNVIEDERKLGYMYRAWCLYNNDYYTGVVDRDGREIPRYELEVQNLFRCESHRERMMTCYEERFHSGSSEKLLMAWNEIRKLMSIKKRIVEDNEPYMDRLNTTNELFSAVRSKKEIALFGAGRMATAILELLRKDKHLIEKIKVVLISNPGNQNKTIYGKQIEYISETRISKDMMIISAVGAKWFLVFLFL